LGILTEGDKVRFVIVTGMSGAGKSTALKTLEDMGFFCVDNLPVLLIEKFAEIARDSKFKLEKIAIGIDIRNGDALNELTSTLAKLKLDNFSYEILYLDASEPSLVKRYKETRREHPLARGERINLGIAKEREKLAFLHDIADYIIDTSSLLARELKAELEKIFLEDKAYNNIIVTIMSFGYKYGIPRDSDLVMDVRFLPNPYYVPELKRKTGNEEAVQEYVMNCEEAHTFLDKTYDILKFLIPLYEEREGKHQLVVSIGCTGGKHRSVTLANQLYQKLSELPYTVRIYHRDITKDSFVKGEN
jgi:UPF0042 nucleotide-binding protein